MEDGGGQFNIVAVKGFQYIPNAIPYKSTHPNYSLPKVMFNTWLCLKRYNKRYAHLIDDSKRVVKIKIISK